MYFFIILLEINLPTPVPGIKSQINYCLSVNDDSFLAKQNTALRFVVLYMSKNFDSFYGRKCRR
jgi:hypothetical protein